MCMWDKLYMQSACVLDCQFMWRFSDRQRIKTRTKLKFCCWVPLLILCLVTRLWWEWTKIARRRLWEIWFSVTFPRWCLKDLHTSLCRWWLVAVSGGAHFYPRDAMLARSLRQRRLCLSVCPSVCHTPVLCLAERKQDREMYTVW